MDMTNITQLISSIGFPIAMSLLLFWYLTKITESHRSESDAIKDAINKLELAITTLVNKLDNK